VGGKIPPLITGFSGLIRLSLHGWLGKMGSMVPSVQARPPQNKPKLLDEVRNVIRRKHFSIRTEQTYVDWVRRFILFHNKRHPREMAETEITAFLTHLARDGRVAASTQNQALSALLFLYKEVLKQDIGWLQGVERAKRPSRLPVVLTRDEVRRIFAHMHGTYRLMAGLLYGSGLRLMECVRLRVKDIDFGYLRIMVRDGKGGKDRLTMLPVNLAKLLEASFAESESAARRRFGRRLRQRLSPRRDRSQKSSRGKGVGMAVCFFFFATVYRSARFSSSEAATPPQ
jgi:integrase